jgi:hypothetical protein
MPADNESMTVPIHSGLTDDNDFVALVHTVVASLLSDLHPAQVWIIEIDNWFDHKWLGYSGNGIIANWMFAGSKSSDFIANRLDSVKSEFFNEKTTFPPFSPNRVLGQWSYIKSGDNYVEIPLPDLPHGTTKAHSSANLNRRIEALAVNALFIWYSGNSLKNGRGSLMVYTGNSSQVNRWFAAFERKGDWTLTQTKGISRGELLRMIETTRAKSIDGLIH